VANSGGPGDVADPGSWNRYSYTQGDPANLSDPAGLLASPCQWQDPGCHQGDGRDIDELMFGAFNPYYGMPAAMQQSIARYDQAVQNQWAANQANAANAAGKWAEAQAIVSGNSSLTFVWSPNLQAQPGQTYQQTVDAYLKGLGVWDLIDPGTLQWTGTGYTFQFVNPSEAQQFLQTHPMFANGIFGLLHVGDVGFPNWDYRSWTTSLAPFSLQITYGLRGWADLDRYNPYSLWGWLQHTFREVLPWWKQSIP
jgi:hypothetical protein